MKSIRLRFLVTSLAIAAGLVTDAARAAQPTQPPNIVFILADDQGWADLKTPMDPAVPEGACEYFHTPNLDRLAREGMRFSSGYAPAPFCTPTRRSIQFGMTPARQRGTEFVSDSFMPEGHLSIPQVLRRANPAYRCAHFGKWGEFMSGPETPPPDYDPNMAANPTALGYDESDGLTGNLTGTQYFSMVDGAEKAKLNDVLSPDPDPKRTFSVTQRAVDFMERRWVERNYPLKGARLLLTEGGIRVPFLVRGPGVQPGSVCREPVAQYDLLPTFYTLAGGREPLPKEVEGGDLGPLLENAGAGSVQQPLPGLVFHRPVSKQQPSSALRQGDYKLTLMWSGPWQVKHRELFNLADDIGERNSLAESMPEKAAEMERLLVGYLKLVNAETAPPPSSAPAGK